jgi:hypothetical protein
MFYDLLFCMLFVGDSGKHWLRRTFRLERNRKKIGKINNMNSYNNNWSNFKFNFQGVLHNYGPIINWYSYFCYPTSHPADSQVPRVEKHCVWNEVLNEIFCMISPKIGCWQRFEVAAVLTTKDTMFWVATSCSLVDVIGNWFAQDGGSTFLRYPS